MYACQLKEVSSMEIKNLKSREEARTKKLDI